jgi:TolB-like protein
MKNILLLSLFCFFVITNSNAQLLKVAILDFENTSGIPKYDGLGKAMSSMLITDIESNVSPKRLQLVERAQIQKILKEQNFQSSSAVDKTTTVKAGKILGVKYLLVGDIYILNDVLVINARLTDTETGDIKFSKKQEGKLSTWLVLKTNIAKELALSISMPFTEPRIPDVIVSPALLSTYAGAIEENDKGNFEKATNLIGTAKEFAPDFGYLDDLKDEVERLKNQVAEQGKKIDVLEKSGGRVVNAKSYDELMVNLNNDLTTFEDRKKIFITIVNQFSAEWNKESDIFKFYRLNKGFNFNNGGLIDCNILMDDLLKIREFINKEKLIFFDRQMFSMLGNSLFFTNSRTNSKHDFTESDYFDFRNIMNKVIFNAFNDESEKAFAKFIILSCFTNCSNNSFKKVVKIDFLESQRRLLSVLKYPYANQIMQRCEADGSEIIIPDGVAGSNTILGISKEILFFLSINRDDLKKVTSVFAIPSHVFNRSDLIIKYYNQSTPQSLQDIKYYLYDLNQICRFFTIPSLVGENSYHEDKRQIEFFSEIPEIIPLTEGLKKSIISLDSISRRYQRIAEILSAKRILEPCEVNALHNWLIRSSDSIALISNIYLLNDRWPLGSIITIIYNNGKDTTFAFIVGKKNVSSVKEFQIIENSKLRNFNKSYTVLFQTKKVKFTHYNLKPNYVEDREKDNFYKYISDCVQEKKLEIEKKEREAMIRQKEEKRKQELIQKKMIFDEKLRRAIHLFNTISFGIDTNALFRIIKETENEKITLDSLFNLNFLLLVQDENYNKKVSSSGEGYNAQLSIPLNIFLIDMLQRVDIDKGIRDDFLNAATINLAHGYLLCSLKYEFDAFSLANTEYNNVNMKYKFSESFNSFSRNEMITADWNEFIEKGLVTKSHIQEFNKKYKIVTNF